MIERPSPNFNSRPAGVEPDLLIIHATVGSSDSGDLSWITSKESKVSYHYLIGRDGKVYRLVEDEKRAWHAGTSTWRGRANCNDYSIGIGISNKGESSPGVALERFTDAQYTALAELTAQLMEKWNIPLDRIVGHCHISPGRKTDPWLYFEWSRFIAETLEAS